MRKYFATIFGVAVGMTAAIIVAARADMLGDTTAPQRPQGGA